MQYNKDHNGAKQFKSNDSDVDSNEIAA